LSLLNYVLSVHRKTKQASCPYCQRNHDLRLMLLEWDLLVLLCVQKHRGQCEKDETEHVRENNRF
jgi:hypothetical protein